MKKLSLSTIFFFALLSLKGFSGWNYNHHKQALLIPTTNLIQQTRQFRNFIQRHHFVGPGHHLVQAAQRVINQAKGVKRKINRLGVRHHKVYRNFQRVQNQFRALKRAFSPRNAPRFYHRDQAQRKFARLKVAYHTLKHTVRIHQNLYRRHHGRPGYVHVPHHGGRHHGGHHHGGHHHALSTGVPIDM